jgi:ABC-type antimicrobial peptide transport system permease subunit
MTLFSALALALAAVGVYGVVAYGVSQQRREFALRMALGATRRDVLALVLRNGVRLVGAGVALGAAGALAAARLMGSVLYGVGPGDPTTYATVVALLTLTGVAAACVPAWRASRVEPVAALRVD